MKLMEQLLEMIWGGHERNNGCRKGEPPIGPTSLAEGVQLKFSVLQT